MKKTICYSMSVLLAVVLTCRAGVPARADETKLTRETHAWARFKPGAWSKVRVTTESLDERGRVASTSSTDTTTLLEEVSAEKYNLQIEIAVEVAGKRFDSDPQFVSQGYLGESAGQTSIVKPVGNSAVYIEDQKIPCQVFTVETRGEDRRRVSKVYYSDKVEPHWVKKESVTTDPSGSNTLFETDETVVAIDMPFKVLTDIVSASVVKTVRKNDKGSTITIAVHSPNVPGGVVAHTSKELDSSGRVIRRSTLELIDYGTDNDDQVVRRRAFKSRSRRR